MGSFRTYKLQMSEKDYKTSFLLRIKELYPDNWDIIYRQFLPKLKDNTWQSIRDCLYYCETIKKINFKYTNILILYRYINESNEFFNQSLEIKPMSLKEGLNSNVKNEMKRYKEYFGETYLKIRYTKEQIELFNGGEI